jgi:hypothetical protein
VQRRCRGGLGPRDLHEVPDVADTHPSVGHRQRALEVDRDRFADALVAQCPAEIGMPPDLLRHREQAEPQPVRLRPECAGIEPDRIEVQRVRVRREQAVLVQPHGGVQEGAVASAQQVEEHEDSVSARGG